MITLGVTCERSHVPKESLSAHWGRCYSQAKNRRNGGHPLGDVVADRITEHRIAGPEGVENRALRGRTINVELYVTTHASQRPQMCRTTQIMAASGLRRKARPEDLGRWEPRCLRRRARRKPARRWCRNTRRLYRASPPPWRRATR